MAAESEPRPALDADALEALSDDELHRLINDLQAVVMARQATAQQTQVQHESEPPAAAEGAV